MPSAESPQDRQSSPAPVRRGAGAAFVAPRDEVELKIAEAARSILRALHRNEAVGVLIDQNVLPEEGVFIDFFGTQACAGTAFVRIAQKTGAAIIPGFALWSEAERRYILRFYPVLQLTGSIQTDTQLLHSCLEQVIREYPDQWLWLHRRWKTRPPGYPSFY